MPIDSLINGRALAVFAQADDGSLRHSYFSPEFGWSEWSVLAPQVRSVPVALQNADGRIEVFAVGPEGALGHVWETDPGCWADWEDLGHPVRGAPSMCLDATGCLQVFATDLDGRLGRVRQRDRGGASGWSEWESFGCVIRGRPSVFQNADGRLELFAIGPQGRLGHTWEWHPGGLVGWSEWADFGHLIGSDPVVFPNADGRLEVFAAGIDGQLGHVWQLAPGGITGWSGWSGFGCAIRGEPAVFQNHDGRLEVFACGGNGRLGHVWQLRGDHGTTWSEWGEFGHVIRGTPVVFQNAAGRLQVFAVRLDGRLGHVVQQDPESQFGWTEWVDLGISAPGGLTVCRGGEAGLAGLAQLAEVLRRSRSAEPAGSAALRADVCVVGGGPAGITVSEALIRAGASVVLLESGSWDDELDVQELNVGPADGPIIKDYPHYLRNGRRRQIQGAATRWGRGYCMPFRPIDFDDRPWVGPSGWPIGQDELGPFEKLAAESFGFDPFEVPEARGALVHLRYQFPRNPQIFRVHFLNLLTTPVFTAELGATVVGLAVDGGRVTGVRAARAAGGEVFVEADTVVLAAGAVENARLLLMHEDRLPGLSPATGRYFMEHPHGMVGSVLLPDLTALQSCLVGQTGRDVLALPEDVQRAERLLNVSIELRPDAPVAVAGPITCNLYARAEQAPNPDSRIVLDESRDRFGCPRPHLEWRLLPDDWTSMVRTVELIAAALEREYGARVDVAVRHDQPWPWDPAAPTESPMATWGNHHMGTTRMAARPEDGVVDPDCLVYGSDNLYVAGSSLYPTGSCANPTFTIVALAHRLGFHLAAMR